MAAHGDPVARYVARYVDTAKLTTRGRTRHIERICHQAELLAYSLEYWEREPVLLPSLKAGAALKAKIRLVVEEHLEEILEEIDSCVA